MKRSTRMEEAAPLLKELFERKSSANGEFPLFPSKIHDSIWSQFSAKTERRAAVLVPILSYEGAPSLLFTTRSNDMPTHASEVSFPGGHFDSTVDETLEDTALREAKEELVGDDFPWESIQILGRASPVPSITGTPVTPIVGVFPFEVTRDTFQGDPREVRDIFYVSLTTLVDIETTMHSKRFQANIPVFPAGDDKKIWGLTAVVTRPILHNLLKPIFISPSQQPSSL